MNGTNAHLNRSRSRRAAQSELRTQVARTGNHTNNLDSLRDTPEANYILANRHYSQTPS